MLSSHRVTLKRTRKLIQSNIPKKYSHLVTFSEVFMHAWGCQGEWFGLNSSKLFTPTTPRIRQHP